MLIRHLSGIYTGRGFVEQDGRRPTDDDCGYIKGPIDIRIDGATIAEVDHDLSTADEPIIEGRGLIALPSFIDPHTHAIFGGERSNEYFMRWAGKSYLEITEAGGGIHSTVRATDAETDDQLRDQLRDRLTRMLAAGSTVVEVKSGYGRTGAAELRLLHAIRELRDDPALPQVRPSFLGLHALPAGRDESQYVNEMIAAVGVVRRQKLAEHVDSFPEKGFFSLESALRFSEASNIPVKVHADELSDLGTSEAFIKLGALSIDHLQCINDRAVAMLATSPTVATMLPATSFFVGLPYANARRLIDAGAKVALATDFNPGTAPALDLQLTHLLAASQMKMTPAEILCATTFNAASALGLGATHGAILPKRVANVLLYDAMPLAQIILNRVTPQRVILRGVGVSPTHKRL